MRLIDADALEQKIRKTMYEHKAEMEIFLTLVDMQPTIEAVPVVHGSWKKNGKNSCGQILTECTVCKANSIEGGLFCRNCGADMRK